MEQGNVFSAYDKGEKTTSAFAVLMRNVYLWMTLALVMTALTATYVANNPGWIQALVDFHSKSNGMRFPFYCACGAQLALVWWLSARIMKISFSTAGLLFAVYAILNGVTMSILFFVYTAESIATTFFVTAGMFGAMGLLGYFTKKDLSIMGRFLLMALIGLIIATIVNIFWANSTLYWITTYAGILLFAGLTAYDTQKIKRMLEEHGSEVNENSMKLALLGSLELYLDFINLFIYLLRIFGNRK